MFFDLPASIVEVSHVAAPVRRTVDRLYPA
jgi:hypothetical protein